MKFSMFFGRGRGVWGFGFGVSGVSWKRSKGQKNGKMYGKWLEMSRTGLKKIKTK